MNETNVVKSDENNEGCYAERMGRLAYFLNLIVLFTLNIFLSALASTDEVVAPIVLIVSIPLVIWAITCHVRRWHDLGKSGWNVLTLFIPFVNFIILLYLLLAPGIKTHNPNIALSSD
jgi:uncharacterized membrane protein YhaH (DUF805 family)